MPNNDILALDRAGSVRTYDADNRLRVETSNLTKSNVCGYAGKEIPGWQELGLDANKIYQMWRHPDELEKAAGTFGGLPILSQHYPVTADDWKPDLVIGATGSLATWDAPFVRAPLSIWAKPAIDGIQNREQAEISSGYRYTPLMTPGITPDGDRFDGIMTAISGQHIAIVPKGRAGPDVVVADAALSPTPTISLHQPEKRLMATKRILSRKAAVAKGVLATHLRSSLAQDAELEDVIKLLEALETPEDIDTTDPVTPVTEDDDAETTVRKLLGDKVSDEDIAKILALLPKAPVVDEEADAKAEADRKAAEEATAAAAKTAQDEEDRKASEAAAAEAAKVDDDKVTKTAMDAAIAVAVKAAETNTVNRLRAARDAERDVESRVGKLNGAFDSAEGVYQAAFKVLGVDTSGVTELPAFKAILKALPTVREHSPHLAQDSAAASTDLQSTFPGAARIRLA